MKGCKGMSRGEIAVAEVGKNRGVNIDMRKWRKEGTERSGKKVK